MHLLDQFHRLSLFCCVRHRKGAYLWRGGAFGSRGAGGTAGFHRHLGWDHHQSHGDAVVALQAVDTDHGLAVSAEFCAGLVHRGPDPVRQVCRAHVDQASIDSPVDNSERDDVDVVRVDKQPGDGKAIPSDERISRQLSRPVADRTHQPDHPPASLVAVHNAETGCRRIVRTDPLVLATATGPASGRRFFGGRGIHRIAIDFDRPAVGSGRGYFRTCVLSAGRRGLRRRWGRDW